MQHKRDKGRVIYAAQPPDIWAGALHQQWPLFGGGARNAAQVGDKNTPAMKEAGRESDSGAEEGYLAVRRSSSA